MWLGIQNVIRANHVIKLITSSTTDPRMLDKSNINEGQHNKIACQWFQCMNDCCLTLFSGIFQLFNDGNKLLFYVIMMMYALYLTNTLSFCSVSSLKQQFAGRQIFFSTPADYLCLSESNNLCSYSIN